VPFGRSAIMIVESLVRYYDILADDKTVKISKWGYNPAKVSFVAIISEGKLTNLLDIRTDGKKKRSKILDVPYQKSLTSAITPFFLCHKTQYVFGVDSSKSDDQKVIKDLDEEGTLVVTKRSLESFEQFRKFHHSLLDTVTNPPVQQFLKFLDDWNPEKSLENPKFAEYKDELFSGGQIVFESHGECLHTIPYVREIWERYFATQISEDSVEMQCLVTGKIAPVSRVHKWITGVTRGQGAPLISFNNDCFCSYGKDKSYNSPISEEAMFKYTTALNYLLEWESKNRIQIGDTVTVFWAETDKKICEDLALALLNPDYDVDEIEDDSNNDRKQDHGLRQLVHDILLKVKLGSHIEEKSLGIDPEKTNFFILGLSQNQGRQVIRFWHKDTFGNFVKNVGQHHLDMEFGEDNQQMPMIPPKLLLKMTVPQKSNDKAVSPLLEGLLMNSIINNTPYPLPMFNAILSRMRIDHTSKGPQGKHPVWFEYARAGFIKACLIRMARTRGKHEEDMITVSLNEESQNVPYRLGRLFAVLEKAQSDTNRELKSTINSKYFSSASTTPAVVFPGLLKLSQHHIAKSEWGFKSDQAIQEIMSGINGFPKTLSLEEQGMFMIGYYHQRKANYRKKSDSDEKTKTQKEE
jgi:CRISPR-associated protein Csd1